MSSVFQALCEVPRRVILDTDIGPDCDDVGAITALIYYADRYGFPIAGICNCTSNPAGNGVIDAIFRYAGKEVPPIGEWIYSPFMNDPAYHSYNDKVAETFSPLYREGMLAVEPSTDFYRRLLAESPDDGTVIVSIGMFNDLSALLLSEPDEFSPLKGMDLFRQKVHAVVSMATAYPSGKEFNVFCDAPSARLFFKSCPTAIFLSDFHLGFSVRSGYGTDEDKASPDRNPMSLSYHLYTKGNGVNASFDLTAVQFAVLGEGEYYGLGDPGRIEFYADQEGGKVESTRFLPDPSGNVRYMTKRVSDETIGTCLSDILHSF